MAASFILGIDLGTTNSVLAYVPLDDATGAAKELAVPQLTAAGTVESRSLLPSFLYLAHEAEARGSLDLPWVAEQPIAVGEMARRQSADVPERTVAGAKSWLAHVKVDRRQPILPWNAPADVPKVSPVTASQRYLEHLVAAWNGAFPDAPAKEQIVVLTVPASFDASARELTREAALAAGLPEELVLLEEPQAAVYAWLADQGDRWRRQLAMGDRLLVCDVGGGTTDLTLVGVAEHSGELVLERIAVGNHLLVGGDNMDIALAHHAAGLLAAKGVKLDPWQSVSLWHASRAAKEALLAEGGPKRHSISAKGRGSRLVGGSVSVELTREDVVALLVDGFFPKCEACDRPVRRRASGFQEIGLPFESDTAVTRHVAAFLGAHGDSPATPAKPTHVLFNGGVFKAEPLRTRLLETMAAWFPDSPPRTLPGAADLDHSVARGAAYYGWSKHRGGMRIRGGTARAYYVGVETSGLAVPGAPRPLRAMCVAAIGMEEGTQTDVPSPEIGLVVGEPAQFRFFSSSTRKHDKPGDLLDRWSDEEVQETDSMEAALAADESIDEDYVPVRFRSRVTELGMLELWCVGAQTDRRWKLEFSVREE